MRPLVFFVLPVWLSVASALFADDIGLSVAINGFKPSPQGDMDLSVTVVNTDTRDFCVLTLPNARKDPTFDGFGAFELLWPRGDLVAIVAEASATQDNPKLVIFRMRADTQVSFPASVWIEDFFPAPIGSVLEVRWIVKGFWCDELDARVTPNPPRLNQVDFATGTFRRWPEDTSIVVQSKWRRFIIPHEQ
ncbi:MAG: hypothetical protein ABI459_07475 [Deltaproteobacteria bacterium]